MEALNEKGKSMEEARIAILGFAFLENSDDPRNTPALPIYNLLKKSCKEVVTHDPYIKKYEGVSLTSDLNEALRGKDCLVIVTRHNQYLDLPLDRVGRLLRTPVIVDGRNVFNRDECRKAGFAFRGVGIPK